LGLAAVRWE